MKNNVRISERKGAIVARQCNLERRILHGQINSKQVDREIEDIEAQYGKDAFNPCKVTPKEKPWTKATLQELHELFQFGAQSKECLRYMAKVSDEVYRAKRLKKMILMGILAVLVCVLLVMVIRHILAG